MTAHWMERACFCLCLTARYCLSQQSIAVFVCRVSGAVGGALPLAYSAWTSLKAFELSNTQLTGAIPTLYTTAWPSLENFTLDGANVMGLVPEPFGWSNLTWHTLQNTPVLSDAAQPFWVLKNQSATLQKLRGLRLGEFVTSQLLDHASCLAAAVFQRYMCAASDCLHV